MMGKEVLHFDGRGPLGTGYGRVEVAVVVVVG
jgi:hypothetical protein